MLGDQSSINVTFSVLSPEAEDCEDLPQPAKRHTETNAARVSGRNLILFLFIISILNPNQRLAETDLFLLSHGITSHFKIITASMSRRLISDMKIISENILS